MERALKAIVITIGLLVALPLCALVAYDVVVFRPQLPAIQALLDEADPEDRSPPNIVRRLVFATHKDLALASNVSRTLLLRFHPDRPGGALGWHPRSALWAALIYFHLKQDEILGLHCTLAYNGESHGLNDLSRRLYGKPLSVLTNSEAATVVAVTRAPSFYLGNPDRLAKRRDFLLSQVQDVP